MAAVERGVLLADTAQRDNLATFVERAQRLDEAAVIRLKRRCEDVMVAWAATGFDVLASRVLRGELRPADLTAGADELRRGLAAVDPAAVRRTWIDPGFAMDSAWRTALPPHRGFVHVDDVPAREVLGLAQRGVALAREHSAAHGPPTSLLDSEVLRVSGGPGSVGIPMRCVFALTGMGFLPQSHDAQDGLTPTSVSETEIVRVRVAPAWLRIDARFGSVFRRRGDPMLLS